MSLIDSISQAIANMEGFNKPGSIAQRNNNPGNLRTWGSAPVVDGYAQFSTPEEGWAALNRQVDLNVSRGLSLQEFFGGKPGVYGGYAPAADKNRPIEYANYVAGQTGLDPTIPINQNAAGTLDVASIVDSLDPFGGSGGTESGVIDWGSLAVLGALGFVLWLAFKDS